MNMRMERLEKQRMTLQREAGFGEMTFRRVLEALPHEERVRFEEAFRGMEQAVLDIKFLNEQALVFAREAVEALHGQGPMEHSLYTPQKDVCTNRSAETAPIFEAKF